MLPDTRRKVLGIRSIQRNALEKNFEKALSIKKLIVESNLEKFMKNYVKLIEKTFSTELEDEQSNVAYLHEFGTVRPKKMFNLPGYVRGRPAPSSFTTIRPPTSREHDRNMTNIKVISYIELKEEREKFRKQIIKVIVSRDTEYNDETIIPSSDEIQLVRYNYYIQHGIDTVHVAPIEQHWISHILDLVPISLKKKHVKEVNAIFLEVKEDFQVAIKKGIVDFVLDDFKFLMKDSITKNDGKQVESFNKSARIEFDQAKQVISKNLFISNSVMVYLHQLWHKQFSDLRLIQVNTFYASKSALDLSDFHKSANESISQAITRLKKDWYPAIHQILSLSARENDIPVQRHRTKFYHFHRCVITIMTHQLQMLCLTSLSEVTDFLTNMQNSPGFKLALIQKNKLIQFDPPLNKFQNVFLNLYGMMIEAVCLPGLDTRLFSDLEMQDLTSKLKPIILEKIVDDYRLSVKMFLKEQWIGPQLRVQDFDEYICLLNGESQEEIKKFLSEDHSFEEYKVQVAKFHNLIYEIPINMAHVVRVGVFEMHRKDLIKAMTESSCAIKSQLTSKLISDYQLVCKQLGEEYQDINDKLLSPPANTAELMALKAFVVEVESVILHNMELKLQGVMSYIILLSDYVLMNSSEMKQNSCTFQWYLRLPQIFQENCLLVETKTVEFQDLLMNRIKVFRQDLKFYAEQVEEFETYGDINELASYLKKARSLDKLLADGLETIKLFNVEESAFGWQESHYPVRKQIADKLAPYKKLYDNCSEYLSKFDIWTQSKIGTYNPVDIDSDVNLFYENISDLEKVFTHFQEPHRLANTVRLHLDNFKEHMPLIMTLGNPGLKDRHWEMISEIVGFPLKPDADLTLAKLIDYGIEEYIARFEVVSDSATKENNLEKKLNQMMEEWKEMQFTLASYRDTGTYILSAVDEIQVLLDDHIVKTQTMKNSPFVKPFEPIIVAWETKLTLLQEVLDEWLKVQITWIYLEPIFSSPDIQQQMPEEGRRFSAVDKAWKDIMKAVASDTKVMTVIVIDKMHERLVKCNNLLEMIQRGLNDYLEKKRLFFPRFFFLSNDELLEILSETKNPTRVQLHLRKCFEGIFKLTFTEDLDITTIISSEDEQVELDDIVSTGAARGQVEKWLLLLESSMKKCIWQRMKDAIRTHDFLKWSEWIYQWPAQTILSSFRIFVTAEINDALSQSPQRLEQFCNACLTKIQSLIFLQRTKLSALRRISTSALIITMEYSLDVVTELLKKRICSNQDPEWLSQLHYYWKDEDLEIRMMNLKLNYCHEYLGSSDRLVITPLTQRCYRSLFNALTFHLGGGLAGPTGTGKVETVRDLAKALGKQCIIFNCSSGFRFYTLSKFFKGLASCGAWVCFSDFDRISLNVLSVIAQQIQTVYWSISCGRDTLLFEGTILKLDPTSSIFISTALGYAERIELPDNMKASFRSVSMMKPDLEQITRVLLKSSGFSEANMLATKIISVHKLAIQELSHQRHYDFGLRSIKAVLKLLQEAQPLPSKENESEIVVEAMKKVNFSKLKEVDLPLFNMILTDLFPNVVPAKPNNDNLQRFINEACHSANLQCNAFFLEKVLQIYEMLSVRQGVAIIGKPFGGKTSAYRVLSEALFMLEDLGESSKHKVEMTIINPKSITSGQLYGQFDPISCEWSDGILPVSYRQFASSTNNNRKWLIFDGPIDSVWIENMNTVLDSSRKLCIMSGEVIQLSPTTNLIFEAMDLMAASPAVVSRCGIVYIEPSHLGWECLVMSWLHTLPAALNGNHKNIVKNLILRFSSLLIYWLRNRDAKEIFPTQDASLVIALMNFFECFMDDFNNEKYVETLTELDIRAQIEGVFFFSCIWSIGGALDTDSRGKFSIIFHALLSRSFPDNVKNNFLFPENLCCSPSKPYIYTPPDQGTVFDFKFLKEGKGKWKLWSEELTSTPSIPRDIPVNQIIVMTAETVRCNALMQLLLIHEKPLLWVGPTGTGKSVYTINFLLKKIDLEKYRPVFLNFSPQTTAKQVQDLIMSRLDKRRKGVYGPALGKKCILFIDDVNMPNEEAYGAKPPVELMRQLIDHNMWFEQKDMIPVKILDVQLIAAVNPTNPETSITPRFSRHFNIVAINEFSDQVMVAIYSKIMLWHLDTRGFSKEFDPCIEQIVSATLAFYKACLLNLRPTPSKVHYMFNLRDFAKVIQGVLLSVPEAVEDLSAMKRLWVHEVMRVYYDRLVSEEDCIWLVRTLHLVCHENLKQDLNEMCSHLAESEPINITEYELRNLIYCDFTNPKADMRHYLEVEDIDTLQGIIEGYLTEYNNMSKKPLNLVMFKYAVEHLTRIARILKQPRSHGLLIGVNGSGKQSLTRLAAHITEYEFFQPEITRTYSKNEWCQDLKTIIRKASASDAHVVLLMEEAQILEESMVEDVCNVLTFGEVPNLFALDEKMDLCERIRSLDRKRDKVLQSDGSTVALYNFFLQTVREQLHIMIALNPTDKRFRQRLRKYPALVNCCAIDWFHIWANDSLSAIGQKLISSADLIKEERDICVEACKHFHSSTLDLAHEAQILYNQIIHVTSVSFVELVILFKDLVNKKKSDLRKSMKNYEIGLEKLENAASQISIMQEELLKLEPALDVANLEVIEVTATVEKETMEFEKTATFIKEDEALTNTLSATVESIKSECDDCMNEVTPIMNTAVAMLNGLNPADLTVLKTIKNPTKAVRMIMEAVCILKDIKPDRIPDPGGSGKMVEDFWAPFKRLLGDAKFVEGLVNYDKSSITAKTGKTLKEKFLSHEEFDVDKVKSVSIAAEGLCRWVVAVIKYNDVSTIVAPKQQELAEAEAKLNHAIGVLKEKQSKVEAAENELKELVKKLETKKLALHNLQANLDSCRTKLQRAEDLISGLGGEKSKWSCMAESLAKKCLSLTGDVMLAAGVIGYLGAFCPNLRRQQSIAWENYLKINRLSCSESFHISEVLGNDVEMLNWKIHGLPNDAVFVENGIILKNSRRWSFIIDPQGIANNWIRSMERCSELKIIHQNNPDFIRVLEHAIQYGKPVLLENVDCKLDSALDSVLLKQTFRTGGTVSIKLADNIIEYNQNFRLYITTKVSNPRLGQEIGIKVTVLNFTVNSEAVKDVMQNVVISSDRPDLDLEKTQSMNQSLQNKKLLRLLEDKILETLSTSAGNILEDEASVNILNSSKVSANEAQEKQKIIEITLKSVETSCSEYLKIADNARILFLCSNLLIKINCMYIFSLQWFVDLLKKTIDSTEKSDSIEIRIKDLTQVLNQSFYSSVSRSLFQQDRLLFSLLLVINFKFSRQEIDVSEWSFLMMKEEKSKHESDRYCHWLPNHLWNTVCQLSKLSPFKGLQEDFNNNEQAWKNIVEASSSEDVPFPKPWCSQLTCFQQILVLKSIRPDRLLPAVQDFVTDELRKEHMENLDLDLASAYSDSNCSVPLVCLQSPNVDPVSSLMDFASSMDFTGSRFNSLSLGEDQGIFAAKIIEEAMKNGTWVLLQNCHLAGEWMSSLDKICESLNSDNTHIDFRLWLTTSSCKTFPINILQHSVKLAFGGEADFRKNISRCLTNSLVGDVELFDNSKLAEKFKKIVFGLCFYHSVILERKQFGSICWNYNYNFDDLDLRCSVAHVQELLKHSDNFHFGLLQYLIPECNYGGKIMDEWDRRSLKVLFDTCMSPQNFDVEHFTYDRKGQFYIPNERDIDMILSRVNKFPHTPSSDVVQVNDNAIVELNSALADGFLSRVVLCHCQEEIDSIYSETNDKKVYEKANFIFSNLPSMFDLKTVAEKFPLTYKETMNTIFTQEVHLYNCLHTTIYNSMRDILRAIGGEMAMSTSLDDVYQCILKDKVPTVWLNDSYSSLKSLGSYVSDFLGRLIFFQEWFDTGIPASFWISGFFRPASFLTGILQNFAHKNSLFVEDLSFDFEVTTLLHPEHYGTYAETKGGTRVYGLFLEGACWDLLEKVLKEVSTRVNYAQFPMLLLIPVNKCDIAHEGKQYICPLYKTCDRRSSLVDCQQSPNVVTTVRLNSDKPVNHWILRGVALITQLSD